jgi:hypothetical protein
MISGVCSELGVSLVAVEVKDDLLDPVAEA